MRDVSEDLESDEEEEEPKSFSRKTAMRTMGSSASEAMTMLTSHTQGE